MEDHQNFNTIMRQLWEGWYVKDFMDDKDFAEASTFKKKTTPVTALYKMLEIIGIMSS